MKDNPKILDDLAGYVAATKGSDAGAVLASKWVNTPDGDVRYDLTLGMVRRMHTENATMKVSLTAAIKVLRPVWDALLANLTPIWKMIEPILETEQPVYVPSNRDRSSCTVCGAVITYIEGISPASSGWEHVDELIDIAHKAQFGSAS